MKTVQMINAQVADLERQLTELYSNPDAQNFKRKKEFIEKHIGILKDAAAEIERLQKQADAQGQYIDNMKWQMQGMEKSRRTTSQMLNRLHEKVRYFTGVDSVEFL